MSTGRDGISTARIRVAWVAGVLAVASSVFPTALWYASPPLAVIAIVADRRAAASGPRRWARGPAALGALALVVVAVWIVVLALFGTTSDMEVA